MKRIFCFAFSQESASKAYKSHMGPKWVSMGAYMDYAP